jgi:uncharacterized protein DUF4279
MIDTYTYEVWASLYIFDFSCSPDEISEELGIRPTATSHDKWPVGHKSRVEHPFWRLEIKEEVQIVDVERPLERLLELAEGVEHQLKNLPFDHKKRMTYVIYSNDPSPGFDLSIELLEILARLRMRLETSVYFSE